MRRRCPSSWELLLSQLFAAVQGPRGLGGHSVPMEGGILWDSRGPSPWRGQTLSWPCPSLCQLYRTWWRVGEAEEDSVRGVVNDLLTGKRSSQGLTHDLLAIMPPPSCPGPSPAVQALFPKNSPSCRAMR